MRKKTGTKPGKKTGTKPGKKTAKKTLKKLTKKRKKTIQFCIVIPTVKIRLLIL